MLKCRLFVCGDGCGCVGYCLWGDKCGFVGYFVWGGSCGFSGYCMWGDRCGVSGYSVWGDVLNFTVFVYGAKCVVSFYCIWERVVQLDFIVCEERGVDFQGIVIGDRVVDL